MGYELEVIGPHVAPTCEASNGLVRGGLGTRSQRWDEVRFVVTVAEDVVLRLRRVGRRLPHDPRSRKRPCHLRRTLLSSPPEALEENGGGARRGRGRREDLGRVAV